MRVKNTITELMKVERDIRWAERKIALYTRYKVDAEKKLEEMKSK